MFRKLVMGGVSLLALMTLGVTAQQPTNPFQLGDVPNVGQAMPPGQMPLITYDNAFRNKELELAQTSQELVKQLSKAEGDKKDKIKEQLTETLGKQFDARQKRHQDEIKALEDKLKKLKQLVEKRQENRREIIGKRLEQLVREAEGLGW